MIEDHLIEYFSSSQSIVSQSYSGVHFVSRNPPNEYKTFLIEKCGLSTGTCPLLFYAWLFTQHPKGLMAITLLNTRNVATALHPLSVGLPHEPTRQIPVRGNQPRQSE